ncbi:MAG: copper chaperone PCu(A)C [Pseudomonadota bacterium]
MPLTRMFIACVLFSAAPVLAHDYSKDGIVVDHPWARPTLDGAQVGAGYLTITNSGDRDDVLLEARSDISEAVELHDMEMTNDVMKMRPVASVDIPKGQGVSFEPGGLHIMFIGLNAPLAVGDRFDLTLVFKNAGPIETVVYVEEGEGHVH